MCTFMLMAALFTIAKIWKQLKYLLINKWRECEYIMEYCLDLKKWNSAICNNMNEPGGHYAK